MTFVSFLTNIGQLADLSIYKIKDARQKNTILKEIVQQSGQKVILLKSRKEEIDKIIVVLEKLK